MARTAIVTKANRRLRRFREAKLAGLKPKMPARVYHRCQVCGRVHGFLRKFQMCRICVREKLHAGELVGFRKASW
jgi:small subunit ribosomal protein S14